MPASPPTWHELQGLDDEALVERAGRAGPDPAGRETFQRCAVVLFERYRPAVRAMCAARAPRGAVDDLEGAVFLRLAKVLDRRLAVDNVAALLATLARRAVATWHKARELRPDAVRLPDDVGPADEGGIEEAEEAAAVEALLAGLPDRARAILYARYVEDRPAAEVAAQHGTTANNVDQIVFRALKTLREAAGT